MSDRFEAMLNECEVCLRQCQSLMEEVLLRENGQEELSAVVFMRALDFGLRTIKVVDLIITDDNSNAAFGCTLARAFFEAAVRVLWASRPLQGEQDPWERLRVYWAEEDTKWANDAKDTPELKAHAEAVLDVRQEVRDRTDQHGVPIAKAPPIIEMLRHIDKANRDEDLGTDGVLDAKYTYANLYRISCRPAHGRPEAYNDTTIKSYLMFARVGLILASAYMYQACSYLSPRDNITDKVGLRERIVKIAEENHG